MWAESLLKAGNDCCCFCAEVFCRHQYFSQSFRRFLLFCATVFLYFAVQYFSQSFRRFLLFCGTVFVYFSATNISHSLSEDFFSFVQLYLCILPTNISRSLSEDFFTFVQLYLCILPPPIFLAVFQRISSLLCNCICVFCRLQYFSQSFRGFLLFCAGRHQHGCQTCQG